MFLKINKIEATMKELMRSDRAERPEVEALRKQIDYKLRDIK